MKQRRWWQLGICLAVAVLVFLFGLNKINLITADIGRHLINGKLIVEQQTLVTSNHYSYTMTNEVVTNHHWLSGVIFYWIWQATGFNGLSVFYAFLLATAFIFFWLIGQRRANFWPLLLTTILSLPLIGLRSEVRPEAFTLLFMGLEIWLVLRIQAKRQFSRWWWLAFALIQALWVNLHLFFFLGWGVVGAMWLQNLLQKDKVAAKFSFYLLLVVIAASFISPFTYKGVIEPFFILKDFGYRLAENQTLLFMIQRFGTLRYWHSLLASILGIAVGLYWLWRGRAKNFFVGILLISFASFAFSLNRFVPMLGLILVGFGSWIVSYFTAKSELIEKSLLPFLSVFCLLVFISSKSYLSPLEANLGMGLLPKIEDSATFFRQHQLKGPIFNNYDMGGYLIYELFPNQRVFVDNRPEAYSPDFFGKYIAAQEDEGTWKNLEQEYGFETIFFYRHDFTPWAQPFLIKRIQDLSWAPIYVDDYVLILVKENEANQSLINKFKLPLEMFVVN